MPGVGRKARVDRDDPACGPRDASAHACVARFLMLGEKHVAMVDGAFAGDDVDCAQAALAPLAIIHNLNARLLQHLSSLK